MPRPDIYFIRHGETDWNREGRLQGQMDIPINTRGRGQALRNGDMLATLIGEATGVDFVSSPLVRTRQTMEIVRAAMDLPAEGYRLDARLRELAFGDWEGRTWSDLKRDCREAVRHRRGDIFNFVPPGGESYAEAIRRVADWLSGIERTTVAVAHGGIMRCLIGLVRGLDEHEIPLIECPQDRVLMITAETVGLV